MSKQLPAENSLNDAWDPTWDLFQYPEQDFEDLSKAFDAWCLFADLSSQLTCYRRDIRLARSNNNQKELERSQAGLARTEVELVKLQMQWINNPAWKRNSKASGNY